MCLTLDIICYILGKMPQSQRQKCALISQDWMWSYNKTKYIYDLREFKILLENGNFIISHGNSSTIDSYMSKLYAFDCKYIYDDVKRICGGTDGSPDEQAVSNIVINSITTTARFNLGMGDNSNFSICNIVKIIYDIYRNNPDNIAFCEKFLDLP